MTENIEQIIADAIANGAPVKLRDESKAYLKYDERKEPEVLYGRVKASEYPIVGYVVSTVCSEEKSAEVNCWCGKGYNVRDEESPYDIIGAWVEPRPTRIINGIEVPAPLSWDEFKPDVFGKMLVFFVRPDGSIAIYNSNESEKFSFLSGYFYETREDAQANRDAIMKGAE